MKIEIAKRLYRYRTAAGLSQEQVAARVGVSRQAVSKWECVESSPDTDNLIALAILYEVTVDELLFADPEQGPVARAARGETAAGAEDAGAVQLSVVEPDAGTATATSVGEEPVGEEPAVDESADAPDADDAGDVRGESAAGTDDVSADATDGTGAHDDTTVSTAASDAAAADETGTGWSAHGEGPTCDDDRGPGPVPEDEHDVHVSFEEGIHVRDRRSGEDVHVGCEGIHVRDGKNGEDVHVGWDGIHVREGRTGEDVRIGWDGVHVRDQRTGEYTRVGWSGIRVDSPRERVRIDFSGLAQMIRELRKRQV